MAKATAAKKKPAPKVSKKPAVAKAAKKTTKPAAKAKPAAKQPAKKVAAKPAAAKKKPAAKPTKATKPKVASKPAPKKKAAAKAKPAPAIPAAEPVVTAVATKPAAKKKAAPKTKPAKAAKPSRASKKKSPPVTKTLRIRLRSFDHRQLDAAAQIIVRTALGSGAEVCGPIPLPITKNRFDLLRSPHVDKDSREQIEIRTYHRLVEIKNPSTKTAEAFNELQIPEGVSFNMKELQWTP